MSPELEEIKTEETTTKETPAVIYDADARQRYEFEVAENGQKYDTAHIYEPLEESRFISFLHSIKARGNEQQQEENEIEVKSLLWDDLVSDVENIEKTTDDWKSLIDYSEKQESLEKYLSVAIVEPETKAAGKRQLVQTETITTECYFNYPNSVTQTHKLKKKTDEWRRKYARIKAKIWKVEQTKGLRRDPKIEYVPQDEKFGELYDELLIETTGFKDDIIPLRFKTAVVHDLFSTKLNEAEKK